MDGARELLREKTIRDGFISGRNSPSRVKRLPTGAGTPDQATNSVVGTELIVLRIREMIW